WHRRPCIGLQHIWPLFISCWRVCLSRSICVYCQLAESLLLLSDHEFYLQFVSDSMRFVANSAASLPRPPRLFLLAVLPISFASPFSFLAKSSLRGGIHLPIAPRPSLQHPYGCINIALNSIQFTSLPMAPRTPHSS